MATTFIGGGNMANALIGGMRARGAALADFRVVEPYPEARTRLEAQFPGLGVHGECTGDAIAGAALVVLAVKPQQMREAARALAPHLALASASVVLSIAAGIRLARSRALAARATDGSFARSRTRRRSSARASRARLPRRPWMPGAARSFVGPGRGGRADLGGR